MTTPQEEQMQKFAITIGLLLSVLLLTGSALYAEIDIPWQMIHQTAIDKTVSQINAMLGPVGKNQGFPDKKPAKIKTGNYEQLYYHAAELSEKAGRKMAELLQQHRFPIKIELGARYFLKRFEIGAREFNEKSGNERIFEFLCRDFASACDIGLDELRRWASPESIYTMEHFWHKNIREGLTQVQSRLPLIPTEIAAEEAQQIWRQSASALIRATNEAGMVASKVGAFDFPAYRLHFAVKYFKAAGKAAVVANWYNRQDDPEFWVAACTQLRKEIAHISAEINSLLASFK